MYRFKTTAENLALSLKMYTCVLKVVLMEVYFIVGTRNIFNRRKVIKISVVKSRKVKSRKNLLQYKVIDKNKVCVVGRLKLLLKYVK